MQKTAIITAMSEEAAHIISIYKLTESHRLTNVIFYENDSIILALAGIGKIQATIATTHILEKYDVNRIINIGIAGSLLGKNARIGDVFLPTTIVQHDMYLPFDGPHLDYAKKSIQLPKLEQEFSQDFPFQLHRDAICVTGDQFIDDGNKVASLHTTFGAHVCEMEAFAVASVAREYGKLENCIFIKAISDGADASAIDAHMNNLDYAMKNSLEVLKLIIN